ncbi:unnamed protein product, partial [Closterium sp. NIES-65]
RWRMRARGERAEQMTERTGDDGDDGEQGMHGLAIPHAADSGGRHSLFDLDRHEQSESRSGAGVCSGATREKEVLEE